MRRSRAPQRGVPDAGCGELGRTALAPRALESQTGPSSLERRAFADSTRAEVGLTRSVYDNLQLGGAAGSKFPRRQLTRALSGRWPVYLFEPGVAADRAGARATLGKLRRRRRPQAQSATPHAETTWRHLASSTEHTRASAGGDRPLRAGTGAAATTRSAAAPRSRLEFGRVRGAGRSSVTPQRSMRVDGHHQAPRAGSRLAGWLRAAGAHVRRTTRRPPGGVPRRDTGLAPRQRRRTPE